MKKMTMNETEEPACSICGKPLVGEPWFDDEEYGDAHTRCIEDKREGREIE